MKTFTHIEQLEEAAVDDEPCGPQSASKHVYVWVVFDGGAEDNPSILDSYPPHVEWFDYECGEGLFGKEGEWWEWMLRQGIAPGQGFILRIFQPEYTKDYWGECDVEFGDVDLVYKQPMDLEAAGRLWFAWITDLDYQKIAVMKI